MEELAAIQLTDDPYRIADRFQIMLQRHNKLGPKQVYFWIASIYQERSFSIMELVTCSPSENPTIEPMDVFIVPKKRGLVGVVLISNHLITKYND